MGALKSDSAPKSGETYTISNATELGYVSTIVNSGKSCAGATLQLTADITLGYWQDTDKDQVIDDGEIFDSATGGTAYALSNWTPIGNDTKKFGGIFDGNNKKISGINIKSSEDNQRLFGYIDQGTVKNVGVEGSNINGGDVVGGIVGYCDGGTVTNCYNTGTIVGSYLVGGITGINMNNVTNCYNTGTIVGSYLVVINSLTNSIYAVVWHPVEFSDASSHWAKSAINDMGSRMIVKGIDGNNYEPERDITRAEFAAIVIRALGLDAGVGESGFADVAASAWYSGYVKTAASRGIITGYGDGTFSPSDKITREQAMTMIARAAKLCGMDTSIGSGAMGLAGFEDATQISSWAYDSVAFNVQNGIITGYNSKISPKAHITRAEVAVIVQRLLQKSKLI